MTFTRPFTFALVLLVPLLAVGHHSTAGRYGPEPSLVIEGAVTVLSWRNPHSLIIVDAIDESGNRADWSLETSSINQLRRSGIQSESIKVGDTIKVAGYPPLTSTREIFATNIQIASGEELIISSDVGPRFADEGIGDSSFQSHSRGNSSRPDLGIFRVWSYTDESPWLFPDIGDPELDVAAYYRLTDIAVEKLTAFDRARDNPTRNCTPKGMPTIMEQPYPMEIVEDGDNILLLTEEYDTQRTIHMDIDSVQDGQPLSPLGFSIGHWEDQDSVLVVTTTHLNWPFFSQLGIPQSQKSRLTERFVPSTDGSRLDYELTVNDPDTFMEPVHLERYWLYLPATERLPYNCTE